MAGLLDPFETARVRAATKIANLRRPEPWDGKSWPPPEHAEVEEVFNALHNRILALESYIKLERTVEKPSNTPPLEAFPYG